MTKIICDRCKREITSRHERTVPVADLTTLERGFRYENKNVDLCPECFKSFAVLIAKFFIGF